MQVADAFLVAFQFINVTRRSFTEGALNAAPVPTYPRVRESEGKVAAAAFAGRAPGCVSSSISIGTTAVFLTLRMLRVISVPALGFVGGESLRLAINNARLMMPYLAFVGPSIVMIGVLNAEHRYLLTAFSPVLFNITLIVVLVVLLVWRHEPLFSATAIAGAVGVAGCLQMLILVQRRLWRDGIATPIRISFDSQIRGFLRKGISE